MKSIVPCFVLAALFVGCGGSDAKVDTTATVRGALVASSFPAKPAAVRATDEAGSIQAAKVDTSGVFVLDLPQGHTYQLAVLGDFATPAPVVFPRSSGRLDVTFRVQGGGMLASLGAVRYLAAAPSGGFVATAKTTAALSTDPADPTALDGECVDGKLSGSGAPCVDVDDAEGTVCEQGEPAPADGECTNGKDETTGAACTDTDTATDPGGGDAADGEDADPNSPMAVPEHNVPDQVPGCDQAEEEDD